ncbi:hypothetical protein BDF20DRAFT_906541 [Mycotypha africana]|uniref:uncharacterized protein n=1 Tax=Mycotypha africana TaxID=64632 RepID=UPI00230054FD|nr:uncharacterized protein BDF20DRAFT_906541 [Mycotypha africana]KAI8977610.1 hypothetical protein BDF20DRAFT_906541 [Mycotypha africana]
MGLKASDIKGIGLTNQRETLITWDSQTGRPLYPAILWSDTRTIDTVHRLAQQSDKGVDALKAICGLPLATYFTAVKLRWLLDHIPRVSQAQAQHRLRVGTVDTWLIYNLTGGCVHDGAYMTDVTNASRTMLMDLHTLRWSEEAIAFFGLQDIVLPRIASSSEIYGEIVEGSLAGVPLAGCLGDQQAALVGHQCFSVGEAKNTYGTGCFMLFNTGHQAVPSKNGLLTTVAYQWGSESPPTYALEGSIAVAGAAIGWLRDNLGVIQSTREVNRLASKVKNTAGVYFVTAFGGLLAPYWRSDARGTLCGITHFTRLEHICRAALEAVCYQSRALLDAMNKDSGSPLRVLKVDGGMSHSDLTMQIQADVLGIPVDRPQMRETTALGAAIAAGFALGIYKSKEDLPNGHSQQPQQDRTLFLPTIPATQRKKMVHGWQQAVQRSFGWANPATTVSTHDPIVLLKVH